MKNINITCPHCDNNIHIKKNGHYNNNQVYKCSKCNKTFTLTNTDRKLALSFYLTGTSIRGIQKALNTSFNIKLPFCVINNWLLNANRILDSEKQQREKEEIKNVSHISILEMDELFTYNIAHSNTIPHF